MSVAYDAYLTEHKANVVKGMEWFRDNLPEYWSQNGNWLTTFQHDWSKSSPEEYNAYDAYFYGRNKSYQVMQDFNIAWLHHIHNNPHHWQHWVLINDDDGMVCIPMPIDYIIEMICDWWSFSWKNGNLNGIFDWYAEHKDNMKLHKDTKNKVEYILRRINEILEVSK